MPSTKKCPQCGLDLTDTPAAVCPMCGAKIATLQPRSGRWIGALIQIALSTSFMLLFRFPKFLIIFFASFILIATAFSAWIKPSQLPARPAPQTPLSHPILFRVVSIAIALSTLAVVSILLFGTVMFLNEWTRWHQYEGQYFERSQFQVTQTYFQRG